MLEFPLQFESFGAAVRLQMAEEFSRHSALESNLFLLPGEVEVSESSYYHYSNLAIEDKIVFRITFSESALLVTALEVVLSIQLLYSALISFLVLIALLSYIICQDY